MSQQYSPQPPPNGGWSAPQQPGPPWPPPPGFNPPPRKKSGAGKALGLGCAGFLAVCVFLGVVAALFDDGATSDSATPPRKAEASASPSTTPDITAAWPDESAPFPPEPNEQDWDAYIAALNAIDPDIVHGKEEKAVDRGRDQCKTIRDHPDDQDMLIEYTNKRFTSPHHPYPEGHGDVVSGKILKVVRKYICPEV